MSVDRFLRICFVFFLSLSIFVSGWYSIYLYICIRTINERKNSNLANNNTENMTKKNKIREMNRMYYYERQQGMVEKRQAKKENYHIIPQILPAQ